MDLKFKGVKLSIDVDSFDPGDPGQYTGDPAGCYPGTGPEIDWTVENSDSGQKFTGKSWSSLSEEEKTEANNLEMNAGRFRNQDFLGEEIEALEELIFIEIQKEIEQAKEDAELARYGY